jgi:hypothetical protein
MKPLKYSVGITITLAAVAWQFAAVWFSAHQLINYRTEWSTSLLGFLGALVGPIYIWNISKPQRIFSVITAVLAPVCAVMIVLFAWRNSSKMFTYWLMKRIPPGSWQQMASDISSLAKEAAARDELIPRRALPPSFKLLGRDDESLGADAIGKLESGEICARVVYGNHNRRWGLLVGPKQFLESWPRYRRIPVATSAQFFIGSDL